MSNKKAMMKLIGKKYPGALDHVRELIRLIGDNPDREGLLDTPYRVVKSYLELFSGYHTNPKDVIGTFFEDEIGDQTDEMVICKDIQFYSMCEHHMIPFHGVCHIGYLPSKKVIGVSKLVRLVEVFF